MEHHRLGFTAAAAAFKVDGRSCKLFVNRYLCELAYTVLRALQSTCMRA